MKKALLWSGVVLQDEYEMIWDILVILRSTHKFGGLIH